MEPTQEDIHAMFDRLGDPADWLDSQEFPEVYRAEASEVAHNVHLMDDAHLERARVHPDTVIREEAKKAWMERQEQKLVRLAERTVLLQEQISTFTSEIRGFAIEQRAANAAQATTNSELHDETRHLNRWMLRLTRWGIGVAVVALIISIWTLAIDWRALSVARKEQNDRLSREAIESTSRLLPDPSQGPKSGDQKQRPPLIPPAQGHPVGESVKPASLPPAPALPLESPAPGPQSGAQKSP